MGEPAISVVVSTYRRAGRLPRLVRALEAQQLATPFEVLLIDNASGDGTWDTLQQLVASSPLDIRCLRMEVNRGPAPARNAGWRQARAPLVAFTDDDCAPSPTWLATLAAALVDADVVQGPVVPDPAQADRWGPFSRSLSDTAEGYYPTANVGYRQAVLERVDGFDEAYTTCEDTDLALRVLETGGRSAWAPEAVVLHDVHRSDVRAYLREKPRWADVPRAVARHPQLRSTIHSQWFWRRSHPPALVAAGGLVLAALGAAGRRPLALLGGAALLAPYARFRLVQAPPPCGPRRRLAVLPVFLAGDIYEVAILVRASLRHRTLVL